MEDNGELRSDLKLPENDLGKEILSKFENGEEFMVSSCSLLTDKSFTGRC